MKIRFIYLCVLYGAFITADISQIKIYPDSLFLDNAGYYNDDMRTNGEELVIKKIIEPNMCIFDVGANIGEWTAKVVGLFSTVQLYAFEPIPVTFDVLRNKSLLGNIKFFNIALSNTQGIEKFHYYVHHSVLSGLFERPAVAAQIHETPQSIQVVTDTLDNFCRNNGIESIDFLKIDTEGAEIAVLQGAMQLLQNQQIRYIQFEYGGTYCDAHITLQEAYRILSSCNYQIYRIVSDGLIHIPQWRDALENYRYSNYFAIAQ